MLFDCIRSYIIAPREYCRLMYEMTMWQKEEKNNNNINNNEKNEIIHTLDTTQPQLYCECEQ